MGQMYIEPNKNPFCFFLLCSTEKLRLMT